MTLHAKRVSRLTLVKLSVWSMAGEQFHFGDTDKETNSLQLVRLFCFRFRDVLLAAPCFPTSCCEAGCGDDIW